MGYRGSWVEPMVQLTLVRGNSRSNRTGSFRIRAPGSKRTGTLRNDIGRLFCRAAVPDQTRVAISNKQTPWHGKEFRRPNFLLRRNLGLHVL
jgi:hypothetical protein